MYSLLCSLLATFLTAMSVAQSMPEPADALDGLDPVMLIAGKEVPGKSALSVKRGGFTYLFSTPRRSLPSISTPATCSGATAAWRARQ